MKYSVNIEKSMDALVYCLNRVYNEVDMEDWEINVDGGGTNYEIYFNFNIEDKEFGISSYPYYDDGLALGQIIKEINVYYDDENENEDI